MSETAESVIARAERMGCGYTINGDEHVFCDDERLKEITQGPDGFESSLWNPGECECKTKAAQIIAALEAAGYAVVPKTAADRIEALEREGDEFRDALREIAQTHQGVNGWPKLEGMPVLSAENAVRVARNALAIAESRKP